MSDPILNGTNPAADRRLMDDVMSAPDPFDGGCPADVTPRRTAIVKADDIPSPAAFAVSIAETKLHTKYSIAIVDLWSQIHGLIRDAYLLAEEDVGEKSKEHFVTLSEQTRNALKTAQGVSEGLMRARNILVGLNCRTAGTRLVD
jgi:hypothetical protein